MRLRLGVLVVALGVASAAAPTYGAQWVVAQDGSGSFRSIQGAIDAADYGDVVYVSPGVYDEPLALKDGVRVVGASASATVVRHAYGFEPVVRIRAMGTGSLERVTIERLPSVLLGAAVAVESAAASLIECVILGGQGAGIEVSGSASSLTLDRTAVTGNVGHGIYVHDGARLVAADSTVEENSASGLVVGAGSSARLTRSTLRENRRCGVAVDGAGSIELDGCEVHGHSEWGVLAPGASMVRVVRTTLSDNAAGGLSMGGGTEAAIVDSTVVGGGDGVVVSGTARLDLAGVRVADAVGDGLRIADAARLTASRLYVTSAGRHGLLLATSGPTQIARSTIVASAGDGVRISAGRPSVTQSILAYNRGAGVAIDASAPTPLAPDLGYNVVWANGRDYDGVARPATDLAVAPELIEIGAKPALLPDSPCIGAGVAWTTVGAGDDARTLSLVSFDLAPSLEGLLDATWTAALRLGALPTELRAVEIGARWLGDGAHVDLRASALGTWGPRASGRAEGEARWPLAGDSGRWHLTYGAEGRFEGARSWARVWLATDLEGAPLVADGRLSLSWPNAIWTADLTLGLSGPVSLRASVGITDLSLRTLSASADLASVSSAGTFELQFLASALPTLEAAAGVAWRGGSSTWRARATYRPGVDALAVEASFGDRTSGIEGHLHVVAGAPRDGDLSLAIGAAPVLVRAGIALDDTGVRLTAGLDVSFGSLVPRTPNLPPVPAFDVSPADPEAGRPVRFVAEASLDPDGELREIWWDFGDGAAAEGRTADHVYSAAGTYTAVLTLSDDDGAAASLSQTVRVWPADTTPVAAFTAYPVSSSGVRLPRPLRNGDLLRLDATGSSDRDGTVVEYAWDLGSDGTYDVTSAEPATVVGPFEAGSRPVTLRVVDNSGRSDAVMQVIVIDKSEPPRAEFTLTPTSPAVRDPVRFTDRSTDTDGSIAAREWDFGDGATSRDPSPTHRYERVGRYTVSLRVVDDDKLSATAERTLDVVEIPGIADVDAAWAVLIGVSDYAEVKDLQYASDDAVAMARRLLDAGVPQDHVRLLLDREGPQDGLDGLSARRATLVNVREALGWLRRMAAPRDLVLIHFSGHGFQGPDDNGDEQDGVDEFFVLWDTLAAAKEDTALRDDEFGASLDRIDSEHVVVFFDGCYSGGLSRSLPSAARPTTATTDLFGDFSVEGRIVFAASSETQDAFESDDLRHGIFTYYVLEGLGGSADANGDRRVTAWELYEHLVRQVPERALAERGVRQDPQLLGEGDARVLLAEAAPTAKADFGFRPNLPYVGGVVAFADQAVGVRRVVGRVWSFGDGATSDERSPAHVYAASGDYAVELVVTWDDGARTAARQTVHVDAAPVVLSVDAVSGVTVLSVGADHGAAVGDRFAVGEDEETLLEIVEEIDGQTSAAGVIRGPLPNPGARLRPQPSD